MSNSTNHTATNAVHNAANVVAATRRAFTLIELLIVVAIIAILAAIAVPNFIEAQTRSKTSRILADMRSIRTGLESYAVDNNNYPPTVLDGRANVMTMMGMARMPFVPFTITTPISYMTDVPLDTFNPRFMHDHKHSFMYFNPVNTPDDQQRQNYHAAVLGVPMMSIDTVRVPKYTLMSAGPDRKYGAMAMQTGLQDVVIPIYDIMINGMMTTNPNMGSPLMYDPTNGTASDGDLVVVGP